MRLFGLKVSRILEWSQVVMADLNEIPTKDALRLFVSLISTVVRRRSVGSVAWRLRMRKCYRCPIYDKDLKRCFAFDPSSGTVLGCACYMPYKALCSEHGWATDSLEPEDADRLGCW